MSATVWQCKCGAKYELREEWLGRRVRCKHCGVITLVEKPSSIKAPPSIPKTSVPSRDTSSLPLNKSGDDGGHDRDRKLPDTLLQREDSHQQLVDESLDVAFAAKQAKITTYDEFIGFAVKTIGEHRTRMLGAYLQRAGKAAGMKGVRPTKDVLGTPGVTRAKDTTINDESSWTSLVVAARDNGQHGKAVELAEQAVREHPRSDWLWRELGGELTKLDRLDEAENALDTAHRLNPKAASLWRHFAALHRKRKNLEGEIESLETLCSLGVATWHDLNLLGIAHHNHRDLAKALKYYRLSAAAEPQAAPWVNLALVYRDPELSQDADAADACRCALALKPDYQQAKELLEATKRKLVPLADRALSDACGLVESDKFFDFYINPFEMLKIADMTAAEGLDAKAIKKERQELERELKFNDGKVSWLGDYSLDKARALEVVDQLDKEAKRRYHLAVYRNTRLLNFLTRGDIRHFLYLDGYFPCDTEELLHREPGFRTFLSKLFAKQYSRVLTRAIEQRLLPVVEVLFDGRRWVEPVDDDLCFDGASKRVGEIVEKAKAIVRECSSRKVSLREIEDFLRKNSLPELFNLLPVHFASYQREIVAQIRSLAGSCFTKHHDLILSRDILKLCNRFTLRDVNLKEQLQKDIQTIEAMTSAEPVRKATQQASSTQNRIWFYYFSGKEYGPVDPDDLTEMAQSGEITPATLVRRQGRDYCEAHNLSFLATAFQDAPTAKPRRPAPPVVRKPEAKVPTERLAKPSDASRSLIWQAGRVFGRDPKSFMVWFIICLLFIWAGILAVIDFSSATKTSPSSRAPGDPAYSPSSKLSTPSSESRSRYRIPSYAKAELDRESRAIDTEKATAEKLAGQLERLGRELKRAEAYLDDTSESEVDDFNRKVNGYNSFLERVRAQNRRLNQLVDSYNEKLRKHGR